MPAGADRGRLGMRALTAPLILVAARARRRPARWVLPVVGVALAAAFACAIAAEGAITGDRSARAVLSALPAGQRAVTVTWQGPPVTATIDRQARALLDGLGLETQTRVALLNPVRLDGTVVRPAAISPLRSWVTGAGASTLGRCRAVGCRMLLVSGQVRPRRLSAAGVAITVVGRGALASAAPLGFTPAGSASPPVLVSGDTSGLAAISGLQGIYRTQSWLALVPLRRLHSWQLASVRERLQRAQDALLGDSSNFSMSAPFSALESASARAAQAPRRLALAGGGALAALAMFVILAAYGLRLDQRDELARLRAAGARTRQVLTFALAEAVWLSAAGLLVGGALGVTAAALLAAAAHLPVGEVLGHSLVTPAALGVAIGGWWAAAALIASVLLAPGGRIADFLAIAAASALALALSLGATAGGTLALLLAPLACVAAGALVYRLGGATLRAAERLSRRGPVAVRLAILGLARAPTAPALAVAFVAVSIGLAGFALGYRATLERGAADQAAQTVGLDARITPSSSFTTPLAVAPLARWRALAGGTVLPVQRTYGSYVSGGAANTVPVLGVPADGLALIRDWRSDGASASATTLARRLAPRGATSTPGPALPADARSLRVRMSAPGGVAVTADLLGVAGTITQLRLGLASARARVATVALPAGPHRLQAIELDQPSGEAATNGHQLAENQAAVTQSGSPVTLGPVSAGHGSTAEQPVSLRGWRGVGAAGSLDPAAGGPLHLLFSDTGGPGIVRPVQPSDSRPVSVLVDAATAGAATPSGQLTVSVDGLPVHAQVVGVLKRFATIAPDAQGFVIADQATLAGALNASLPGQGAADELWIATSSPARLREAVGSSALDGLGASFRADVQRSLSSDPIAEGVLGALAAAAGVAALLAVLGLLVALLGAMRQPGAERDLEAQGLGPDQLRAELGLRVLIAGALGTLAGLVVAGVLTRLAVVTVRAAGTVAAPDPPLTAVVPFVALATLGLLAVAAFALVGWLATGLAIVRRSS